ncbi:MAG TPA: hypothetical protein VL286_06660 [Rhizomicrobium sp.]|jgi:hypothetical protein|nr:hypothetical protein [Rhizomicrobium sp.]
MSKRSITEAVAHVVDGLTDFSPEERRRIVQASLTLLGDASASLGDNVGEKNDDEFPAKARMWMKQYGLTAEQMSQVFHSDENGMEIIAPIPGSSRREQVRNAYVLSGIARFLLNGETKFDDKTARQICERGGFFDHTNHSKYMKGGSEFIGSKERGWVLTPPGLKHGAALIAELAK